MKMLKAGLLGCSILIGVATQAFAEKKFEGVHLKMLACADTSVTRLVKILDEFKNATGADVTVDLYPYPGLIDKIVVETSSPTPSYQLLWVDSPWVGQLGEAGSLLALNDLAKRDAKEMGLADIMPVQLQENSWQGKLYAIPASGMVWGMQYRKDLLENPEEMAAFKAKYGYDLAPAKTYKQYYDIAQFFTRKKGEKLAGQVLDKDFYGTAQAYSRVQGAITHDYFGIMRGFGGDFWDPKTGLSAMNGPAQIAAAEYMKSLIPFNPPDWGGLMWDLRTGYMERGEDAESLYWSVRTVRLENPKEAKVVGKVGYSVAPTSEGQPEPNYTGALSFAISSKVSGKEEQAAWEFIKWGTSEKIMRQLADQGISQTRRSILSDPELQKKFPYYKYILAGDENARRRIFHPFYADVEETFGVELNKYMIGDTKTAKEALDNATNAINAKLAMFPLEMRLRWVNDAPSEVSANP